MAGNRGQIRVSEFEFARNTNSVPSGVVARFFLKKKSEDPLLLLNSKNKEKGDLIWNYQTQWMNAFILLEEH